MTADPAQQRVVGSGGSGKVGRAAVVPHETLPAIDKARRVLGYEPQFGWRKQSG